MRSDISVIAWDFDGVLNRNVVDGRFIWADTLESDLGIALDAFERGVFDASFLQVISGKRDIKFTCKTGLTGAATFWMRENFSTTGLPRMICGIPSPAACLNI